MKSFQLLFWLVLTSISTAFAQPGMLDGDFSSDGKATTYFDLSNGFNVGSAVEVQPDGKIVVGGYAQIQADNDMVLLRYNTDGALDNTFSQDGKTSLDFGLGKSDMLRDLAILPDGKILIAGAQAPDMVEDIDRIILARYSSDGVLDFNFGIAGKVTLDPSLENDRFQALDIKPDGKFIVVGNSLWNVFVAQFNENGTLDNSFATNGVFVSDIASSMYVRDVIYAPDGKILIAGYGYNEDFMLMRLNANGTLDNTFSNDGWVATDISGNYDFVSGFALDGDKIVVAGGCNGLDNVWRSQVVRYNSNGTLDLSFNGSGKLQIPGSIDIYPTDFATGHSIIIQPDGKYLIGATWKDPNSWTIKDFALMRINNDGSTDYTFGNSGIVRTSFLTNQSCMLLAITLQPDLRIIATGRVGNYINDENNFDIATARYLSGLNLGVTTFGITQGQPLFYPNPITENETLNYTLLQDEMLTIELIDAGGALVKSFFANNKRHAGPNTELLEFPSSLVAGHYVLTLKTTTGTQSIRVVK